MIFKILKKTQAPTTIDRLHPATAVDQRALSSDKAGSTKHTIHVSLDFNEAPCNFKVGDSIGIYPQNDPHLVATSHQSDES